MPLVADAPASPVRMIARYFETLRHLKPIQFAGRLRRLVTRPKIDLRPAPRLRDRRGPWAMPWARDPSLLGPARFHFLNVVNEIAAAADWNRPDVDRLWLYNLHYFDDLNAIGAKQRSIWHRDLISRWISNNPPGFGTGWEPYPLSLRIVNWIKWALSGGRPTDAMLHSLAVQTRFLASNLEWHLLGNHLLANAKALVFAGGYFAGAEAEAWLARGLSVLNDQLAEQVLADGGHCERSPMYHALVMEDLLDLGNLLGAYAVAVPPTWRMKAAAMFSWLGYVTHPDGDVPFFNDATFGIAPTLSDLTAYAARVGWEDTASAPPVRLLESTGFARIAAGSAVVLADVGSVGPDYLPGHAHAGTLSFELSLNGQRVLVNSGTSVYELCDERQRQRGTCAHNTLQLDGTNSSDVWAGFRVGRRARVMDVCLEGSTLGAGHDGYRFLSGRPLHRRVWQLHESGLDMVDSVTGAGEHVLKVYFHVHPDCRIDMPGDGSALIRVENEKLRCRVALDAQMTWVVERTSWHPGFGRTTDNFCLVGTARSVLPYVVNTHFSWGD